MPFHDPYLHVLLTSGPLRTPPPAHNSDNGALVDFHGVVRSLEGGRPLRALDYEAFYDMALHQLRLLAAEAAARFGACEVILHHRIGLVAPGEPSLFLRVQTPHRAPALQATAWLIEQLKLRVPIWKRPVYAE